MATARNALVSFVGLVTFAGCTTPRAFEEPTAADHFHNDYKKTFKAFLLQKAEKDVVKERPFRMLCDGVVIDKNTIESEHGFIANAYFLEDSMVYICVTNTKPIPGNILSCKDGSMRCMGAADRMPENYKKLFAKANDFAKTQKKPKRSPIESYFEKDSLLYLRTDYGSGLFTQTRFNFATQEIAFGSDCVKTFDLTLNLMRANTPTAKKYEKAQAEWNRRQTQKALTQNR